MDWMGYSLSRRGMHTVIIKQYDSQEGEGDGDGDSKDDDCEEF